jgi:hypothetical protein
LAFSKPSSHERAPQPHFSDQEVEVQRSISAMGEHTKRVFLVLNTMGLASIVKEVKSFLGRGVVYQLVCQLAEIFWVTFI